MDAKVKLGSIGNTGPVDNDDGDDSWRSPAWIGESASEHNSGAQDQGRGTINWQDPRPEHIHKEKTSL